MARKSRLISMLTVGIVVFVSSNLAAQNCAIQPLGVVASWKGENTAADSNELHNGTLVNGATFAPGRVGQALSFDGVDDFVRVTDNPSLSIPGTVSIEFWAKRLRSSSLGFAEIVVEKGGDWTQGQTNYGVGLHNSGFGNPLYFYYAGGFQGVAGPSDLEWHHYAVIATHGQPSPRFFIDGIEQMNITFSGGVQTVNLVTSNLPLHIGAQSEQTFNNFGNLLIDELAIFNRALSSADIRRIYNAGVQGKCPVTCTPQPQGIVSWWRGEGNPADARNAHNGTLQNGTAFTGGRVGQAFSFDGIDDAVDLGPWFNLQTFSLEFWVRSGGAQQQFADIIDNNHTGSRSWVVQYDNTGNQYHYAAIGDSGDVYFNLPPGEWHHIVISRGTNTTAAYQDGVLIGTTSHTNPITYDGSQFLRLSNWGGGGRHFNGLIDEVTVYDRSLSQTRAASLFGAGPRGKCTGRSAERADFDGDGRTDLSVFRPSEANWYLNRSTTGLTTVKWGISTDTTYPGDFDGDGVTDLAVFRPSSMNGVPDFYVLNSSTITLSGFEWGQAGDVPVAGDYDGDNRTDVAVFRSSENNWYIHRSSNGGARVENFGLAGDIPMAVDYDDDGSDNIAVYRPSSGTWYIAKTIGIPAQDFVARPFGLASDKLVPADYDGDGAVDIAVFRPSTGVWYINKSSTGTTDFIAFGTSTDLPVPGDYDGDGRDDLGIYRGNGQWWINRTTSGSFVTSFGNSTDVPIPSRYIP